LFVAGDRVVRIAGPACSANCHPGRVDSAPLGTADFTQAAAPADVVGTTSTFGAHGDDLYVFADGFQDQPAGRGILRSSDGGRTWQTATSAPCGTSAILLGGGSRVAGDGSIIADCDGSSIRVAAPGSTDFSDARPLPAGPGYVMIVAADSAQVIVAVRLGGGDPSGSCYRSTDGGQTWQRGATLPDIHSVSFASGSVGFAHDEAGSFYITHDGGLTWSQQDFVR
jgi:photosystem II stability/assembly factor-like uncharacterized protein